MRVLVIEDNTSTRTLLEAILSARGHDVVACADAETGLARFAESPFTLAVVDWLLPGLDGLEACGRLRKLPGGDRCVVLIITSRDQPDDLRAVLRAGADDYVAKPVDVDSLNIRLGVAEKSVTNLLERKRAEHDAEQAFDALQRSRDDLTSILDKFSAGAGLFDPEGCISYVNSTFREFFGLQEHEVGGRHWDEVFPLAAETREALNCLAEESEDRRMRVQAIVDDNSAVRRWLEIEVRDDPRDPRGKIWFVQDQSELHNLRRMLDEKARFHDLVGKSEAMQALYEQIRRVSEIDSTVLIVGETGTGKELVARAIHHAGHRRNGPFVAVNCAGLTDSLLSSQLFGHKRGAFTGALSDHKGFFETAAGGTIFLDEIGDVPMTVQTNLLRVLQEREILRVGESMPRKIDVRVLAATHHDLAADVVSGSFRADLLYRIRVARITLPPLRRRREDIPLLVKTFLGQLRSLNPAGVDDISFEAMRLMLADARPGNVRELRAATEFAVIRCRGSVLGPGDLPPEVQEVSPGAAAEEIYEGAAGSAVTPQPVQLLPARDWKAPAVGQQESDAASAGFSPAPMPLVDVAPAAPAAPAFVPPAAPVDEKDAMLAALAQCRGKRAKAARKLGMSRSTFYRRLAEYAIATDDE